MRIEDQLAELRAGIAVLAARRLVEHPLYRTWIEDSTFTVDGHSHYAEEFIAQSVTAHFDEVGRLTIDLPLRSRRGEPATEDRFYVPQNVRCIIYGLTCRRPGMRVTLMRGDRPCCVCEGADLQVGQLIRPIFLPVLIDPQLQVFDRELRSTSGTTVLLHTLMNRHTFV